MSAAKSYGPLPEARCPECDYKLNGATCIHGVDTQPDDGDVSICLNCGQLCIYRSDLTLRKISGPEVGELMKGSAAWASIEKAQQLIRQRGRFV